MTTSPQGISGLRPEIPRARAGFLAVAAPGLPAADVRGFSGKVRGTAGGFPGEVR
ncbi:hypothetical protein [Sphaerisporangium aureirubrum]|uniref:Uncharacterized protein n=1 Tax=Sphaerisporangium aureirubrum TaxID=1544736 RepID=A0ABW1NJ40_9ACTN